MLTIFNNNIGLRELDKNNIAFGSRQDCSLSKISVYIIAS